MLELKTADGLPAFQGFWIAIYKDLLIILTPIRMPKINAQSRLIFRFQRIQNLLVNLWQTFRFGCRLHEFLVE